jgi:AcrR family transcriptional regulator
MPIGEPRFISYVPETGKEQRYHDVARAVVEILLHRRPEDVSVSAVARRAGVSRSWIYKYFGKDVNALLAYTVQQFGTAFVELDELAVHFDVLKDWRAWVRERTQKALDDVEAAPWVMVLYFRHRHNQGPIGQGIREVERRHADKILASIPPHIVRSRGKQKTRRFVEQFAAMRNGVYFLWVDPAKRMEWDRDELTDDIMKTLDAFVGETDRRANSIMGE